MKKPHTNKQRNKRTKIVRNSNWLYTLNKYMYISRCRSYVFAVCFYSITIYTLMVKIDLLSFFHHKIVYQKINTGVCKMCIDHYHRHLLNLNSYQDLFFIFSCTNSHMNCRLKVSRSFLYSFVSVWFEKYLQPF